MNKVSLLWKFISSIGECKAHKKCASQIKYILCLSATKTLNDGNVNQNDFWIVQCDYSEAHLKRIYYHTCKLRIGKELPVRSKSCCERIQRSFLNETLQHQ